MKQRKPKTHEAEFKGRRVQVTVPPDPTGRELLVDALKDSLSPEAIVAIASYLQCANLTNHRAMDQVRWFRDLLTEVVGVEEFNRIVDELGL